MTSVMRLGGLAVLAVGLLLSRAAADKEGDLLKKSEQERQVLAQKLELVVSEAVRVADDIGKKNPMGAVAILREAKAKLEADKDALKPERYAVLSRRVELALKDFGWKADNPTITPNPMNTGTGRSDAAAKRWAEEQKRINDSIARQMDYRKGALASAKEIGSQKEIAFFEVNKSIIKSAIPEYRDIAFPADWLEKTKRRSSAIQLTEKEKAIVKALNTVMTIELEGKTFKEVLEFLREKTGVPIIVDQRALDDLNITYNAPINLNLRQVPTRLVLKRLFADLGLTYVMKDEAIQVTTPARAKEMLTIRVYSVADLIPVADMRLPAIISQIQAYQTLQMLVVLITQTVEPDSWEVNGKGGLGTIQFDPIRFSLIVKQTAEMHYLLGLSAGMK